eukprot:7049312-Heterocapsa_arctica.AAC.1
MLNSRAAIASCRCSELQTVSGRADEAGRAEDTTVSTVSAADVDELRVAGVEAASADEIVCGVAIELEVGDLDLVEL